jgi:hypothetical protein
MPRFDDARERVERDVVKGLGDTFAPIGDPAISVQHDYRERMGDSEVVPVGWIYRCRHSGDFQGLFPTNRELEIHGMTVVDYTRDRERPMFHRYVDWLGVITQLGLSVSWRIPVTEDEHRAEP